MNIDCVKRLIAEGRRYLEDYRRFIHLRDQSWQIGKYREAAKLQKLADDALDAHYKTSDTANRYMASCFQPAP